MPGHLNGSSSAGGLEETSAAPAHNVVRSAAERHGQAGVEVVDSGTGPPAVGTGRYGPERLFGMRRRMHNSMHSSFISAEGRSQLLLLKLSLCQLDVQDCKFGVG